MEFLSEFTYLIFWFTFLFILMVALVYWFAKGFAWFLNEVFDLKKTEKIRKRYEDI